MTRTLFPLILRNILGHPVRSLLTIAGVTISLLAFVMIQTMIDAWYSGVKASAKDRLVTRNNVSLVFPLPIAYRQRISQVTGVRKVAFGNWFGGIYKEEKNRFAQFAVDPVYLELYPEYKISEASMKDYLADQRGVLVGRSLADQFGLKVGDPLTLTGTIYPGAWDLIIRGIFEGRDDSVITKVLFFHWKYLNEQLKKTSSSRSNNAGFFVIGIDDSADPASISKAVDERFANSFAETLTETETEFQKSFISMSSTIIVALNAISLVVIVIILLVLANTLLMASRERYRDYAIMRTLGFQWYHLALLVFGEGAILIFSGVLVLGTILTVIFSLPTATLLGDLTSFFPTFRLNPAVLMISIILAIIVGILSGIPPFISLFRMRITDGLRRIG